MERRRVEHLEKKNAHETLQTLINSGKLQITSLFSIPRTGSTVISRVLHNGKLENAGAVVMYNEPSNLDGALIMRYDSPPRINSRQQRSYEMILFCYRIERVKLTTTSLEESAKQKKIAREIIGVKNSFQRLSPKSKLKACLLNLRLKKLEKRCDRLLEKQIPNHPEKISEIINRPIILLLKDHTTAFAKRDFEKRTALSNNIVFSIREPLFCSLSMLCRYLVSSLTEKGSMSNKTIKAFVNNYLLEPDRLENLSEAELQEILNIVDPKSGDRFNPKGILRSAREKNRKQPLKPIHLKKACDNIINFSNMVFKTGWENFQYYSELTQNRCSDNNSTNSANLTDSTNSENSADSKKLAVLHYDSLLATPESTLIELTNRLHGIDYQEEMHTGWKRDSSYSGALQSFGERNLRIWFTHVNSSNGIRAAKDGIKKADYSQLPPALRETVKEAEIVFQKALTKKYCISSCSEAILRDVHEITPTTSIPS